MNLCEMCGKNQAEVHLTQIIENNTTTFHLCEECARKRGIDISLLGNSEKREEERISVSDTKRCNKCGFTYENFKTKGWLGCDKCYYTFRGEIEALLLELNGTLEYKGRVFPSKSKETREEELRKKIKTLRAQLMRAIKNEQFEEAASIRDAIQSISRKVIE
ncbi:MAG: UvrB/UvrC motif-containing protein [Chitinispirillaceae bacterium]|nr:UvrB/UvrC motif-containing protein [Chitinispirillaceae bacterium]